MEIVRVFNVAKKFTHVVEQKNNKKRRINEDFFALENISFDIQSGEIVGILGPNGAGKTTLLRILAGIMESDEGSININGLSYKNSDFAIKKQLSYVSNNTKLYGRFTPRELLFNFGMLYQIDKATLNKRIDGLTSDLNLGEFIDNKIDTLSTGQYQRTNIARCLIHDPMLYIFDEPTLGLDVISTQDIVNFMKNKKKKGKSIVYSTHYMEEAEAICDRIILINNGKIIEQGAIDTLKSTHKVSTIRELFFKLIGTDGTLHEN